VTKGYSTTPAHGNLSIFIDAY